MTCYLCDGEGAANGGKAFAPVCAWCLKDLGYDVATAPRATQEASPLRLHFLTSHSYTTTTGGFAMFKPFLEA